ncbi:hypothetical protein B0J13DRAFT_610973 [Dactylonectria estremocensis]|uniref:Uncharacterized protein n=1 Tax=Dactylonectria estremocensis TaxID=1079267 RepID=A0A9P9E2J3_9HYPO|nr:hypothetical protein B0J13DRAFT_610973 [Dactylonectria estremocensis]
MKTATFAVALLGLFPSAFAETLAASPTESYGCEPHDDHWHCEGARATLSTAVAETAAAATTSEVHDHDHEDEDEHDHSSGTGSLAPSPTESWGCEPHGDHYHCSGAVATLSTVVTSAAVSDAAATTTEAHDDEDDHDHSSGTGTIAASPTESYGCEPHGDHWHCDGARATTGSSDATIAASASTPAASDSTPTASGDSSTPTGAAAMDVVPILGMVAAAVFAL